MYNRYIPQADGSYRRNRMQDTGTGHQIPQEPKIQVPPPPPSPPPEQDNRPCPGCIHHPSHKRPGQTYPHRPSGSVTGWLKQLLPRDFDIEDLIVILLLLLMAGDCQEDQNTAMLTLALYLFL